MERFYREMEDDVSASITIAMVHEILKGVRHYEDNRHVITPMKRALRNKKLKELAAIEATLMRLNEMVKRLNGEIIEEKYLDFKYDPDKKVETAKWY